ncbi:MAG: TIGR04283 family arsenosugar biosynthesis glycosyltransferase [Hyphomicrobiales bacterium]|nr:TIGR04283 family arsenosugar biosynthesis glycosyltransferase [Hyphomicrobiales bacterium]
MPVLDEAERIAAALETLTPLRARGVEIVVVDGGSIDATLEKATSMADLVIEAPRGRASQMNAGAGQAKGDALLFLHCDTQLPEDADRLVLEALARSDRDWGRFDVELVGRPFMLRIVAFMMNWRSRLTGIATGDQAIFVRSNAFAKVGFYPDIPLMEDIALSKALKRLTPPAFVKRRALASARRFEARGLFSLIFLMWALRLAYWAGVSPEVLARFYGYAPRSR